MAISLSIGKPTGGGCGGGGGGTLMPWAIEIRLKNINNIWAIIFLNHPYTSGLIKFGCKSMKKRMLTKFFQQFLHKINL